MHAPLRTGLLLVVLTVATVAGQYQPIAPDFSDLVEREELQAAVDLTGAQRVARFVQVSDAHILDDDVPQPMRVGVLDAAGGLPTVGGLVSSAERPQEEYTDELLNSLIASINSVHAEDALSFVINTGDNIDNALENELMRFIDNWEGTLTTTGPVSGFPCVEDGQSTSLDDDDNDEVDDCTYLPSAVSTANTALVAGLPWFSAFGNHDTLLQGNVPIEPAFQDYAETHGRYYLREQEFVGMHFRTGDQCLQGNPWGDVLDDYGHGYGFAKQRLCDTNQDNDGYYSFDLSGIHFIVLNTVNDDWAAANENLAPYFTPEETAGFDVIGGYAEGAIDPEQFEWLSAEINSNSDRLVVLMSHHTVNSMFTDESRQACCGPDGESLEDLLTAAGFKTGKEVMAMLAEKPNVVAWVGGHTHQHRIQAKNVGAGVSPGFWNIESSSVIDLPQEARVIEIWVTADGRQGFITTQSFTHSLEDIRTLAGTDTQHEDARGEDIDQNVLLWFDVPAGVKLSPQPSLPRYLIMDVTGPVAVNGTHGQIDEPLTISVSVTENLLGIPVPDLEIDLLVRHADPDDYKKLKIDVDGNMSQVAPGIYEHTFTPVDGAVHFVSMIATDPSGTYEPADRTASLSIVDPAAEEEKPKKKSPGAGLLLVGFALVFAALATQKR